MIAAFGALTLSKPVIVRAILGFLAFEAVVLALGGAVDAGPMIAVVPAIIAIAFATTTLSPIGGCMLLIGACFIDRPEIPVGPMHMRVPELAAVGLASAVLVGRVRSGKSLHDVTKALLAVPLFWPMAAFLATNYLSILFSPDARRSIELNLIYTVLVGGYVGFVMACDGRADCRKLGVVVFLAGIAESVVGLGLLWVGSATHQAIYGIQFDPETLFFDAMGSLQDANYFGSFMITPFVIGISLVLLHLGSSWRSARLGWIVVGLVLLALAMSASLTRGAWVGLAGALFVYFILAVFRVARAIRGRLAGAVALSLAVTAVGLFIIGMVNFGAGGLTSREAVAREAELARPTPAPSATSVQGQRVSPPPRSTPANESGRSAILVRIEGAIDITRGSTQGRLYTAGLALNEWRANPIFGVGTGSYNSARTNQDHPWILNMFVTALHDSGLVGLAVLIWLVASYLRLVGVAAWRQEPSYLGLLTLSLLAGSIGLFIAFQASTGMILMYPWVIMALGVSIAVQSRPSALIAARTT